VIGGGVAGLVAARELAVAGLRPLVIEAWSTPGGVVGQHEVDGLRLDAGAESFATRGGVVAALADELGLTDRVVAPEPHGAWVRLPHGAGPLPRTGLLGIPADPWAADVRRTIGTTGSLRAALDRVLPASVGLRPGPGGSVTLGGLVRARMGRRVLDRLVRPVVAGVHAAEPDDIAADAVAPGLTAAVRRAGSLAEAVQDLRALAPAGSAVQGFRGGLHVLVDALVEDLAARGGTLRTGVRAVAVAQGGPGFRVTAETTDGTETLEAARLVVATPRAVDLLTGVAPAVDGLHTDPGADIVLVTLVLDAPALDAAPRGTGVLVARSVPGVRAKALTHATAKWGWLAEAAGPGRHVVRLSYGRAGGGGTPADDPLPDDLEELTALALRDAVAVLGVPLTPEQVRASARVRWSQGLPVPSATHRRTVTRVREAVAAVPGLAVAGAWVSGNGLASVVPGARAAAGAVVAARRVP
jgi:oxygen-dependent protoporphyrinogen oxidase